jgi:hypothetical protein
MSSNIRAAKIILRWGLAFVFFYAAIAGLLHPDAWVGFFPRFLHQTQDYHPLLTSFSVFEIFLAAWLFWGKKLVWSSSIAVAMLVGVVVPNFDSMPILFRDIGLIFMALALLELARGNKGTEDN